MATSLQKQLAAIKAKSTDQLNLKAQKERHSRSLLFEPREAAGQTFDTIYQICSDGFTELCQLDRRFDAFAGNLFAEGSAAVEREHMSAKENDELNKVIEQFLGLISGRLLLLPAHKSMEWLVRRWKVHEYNSTTLVFAFLPYHDQQSFPAVLSLLPSNLPHALDFLRPYIASLASPPRHVLASAAVSNSDFFSQYTSFVLETASRKQQSSIMLGLWTSTVARALNAMLDSAQSGRAELRRQKMEDVMTKILPILQDTLAITTSEELFLAACIIITLLASRGQLIDTAIDALMDGVTRAWSSNTLNEAVQCLILLAEEKDEPRITRKVANAFIETSGAIQILLSLQARFETGKLVTGIVHRALRNIKQRRDRSSASVVKTLLSSRSTPSAALPFARNMLTEAFESQDLTHDALLTEIVTSFPDFHSTVSNAHAPVEPERPIPLDHENEAAGPMPDVQIESLPEIPQHQHSFLDADELCNEQYTPYFTWFEARHKQDAKVLEADLVVLFGRSSPSDYTTRLLTFLATFWCQSQRPTTARVLALDIASKYFARASLDVVQDCQALYPSLLYGLCDHSQSVRRAAVLALTSQPGNQACKHKPRHADRVYGDRGSTVLWLPHEDYATFFKQTIGQQMQESILSATAAKQAIVTWLNDSHECASRICEAFASHAINDGRPSVAGVLLSILQKVDTNADAARRSIIVPFLNRVSETPVQHKVSQNEQIAALTVACLTHRSAEELGALKLLAETGPDALIMTAYNQIASIFKDLDSRKRVEVAEWMIDRAISRSRSDATSDARRSAATAALKEIETPLDVLSHRLTLLANRSPSTEQARPWKRARVDKSVHENFINDDNRAHILTGIQTATLCLELMDEALHHREFKKQPSASRFESYTNLLKSLFSLLGEVQSWQASTGSDFAYLQSLAMANMAAILDKIRSSSEQLDVSILRTDLIVDTLRSSTNSQVHNSALLLTSKIASMAPQTILHSVMPLFTFMSSSTLRQADAYSAHIIAMTIESIVPPLVASLKKRRKDLVSGASELLLSFIAAFEHIPSPRRLDTFVQLLKTLGPDDTLHAALAMLIERYDDDTALYATLHEIMSSFTVETQMSALAKYLDLTSDACRKRRTLSDTLLGFNEKNAAETHASVRTLLGGFANLLKNGKLHGMLALRFHTPSAVEHIRATYGQILELLINIPHIEGGALNFDEPGLRRTHGDALEALLQLLPLADFIESSAILMQAGTEAVRTKVFASLTKRVQDARAGDSQVATVFLDALPNCAVFLGSTQPIAVRQAALICIDAICEKFGRLDREAVGNVMRIVTGEAALASDSPVLQTASLLCLASAVEILGESFVSLAADSIQSALSHVEAGLSAAVVNWTLTDAAFSFINALMDCEAWLLGSGHNLERTILLACIASQRQLLPSPSPGLAEFYRLLPRKVKLEVVNPVLVKVFNSALDAGLGAITRLVKIEHSVLEIHSKKEVLKHAPGFLDFMLRAFGIREASTSTSTIATQERDIQMQDLEAACNETTQSMLDLTLKLNDVTFRPFFIQLVEWTGHNALRAIALFDFTALLFDQLGSVMTSYTSFILENISSDLEAADKLLADPDGTILLGLVLSTLSASLRHDQDDFWAATSHFDVIAEPLLDMLSLSSAVNSARASDVVVDLASAVSSSPELLKVMNTRIMRIMREGNKSARLSAVKCQRAITQKLTFDWLNMLPEMLPFISELLEDDDEVVEREALRWVSELEDVTGESLEGMLT